MDLRLFKWTKCVPNIEMLQSNLCSLLLRTAKPSIIPYQQEDPN